MPLIDLMMSITTTPLVYSVSYDNVIEVHECYTNLKNQIHLTTLNVEVMLTTNYVSH